jgi:hypothetical protein
MQAMARNWSSMVKPTLQRRKPGFTESCYGYRSFKELIEDAERNKWSCWRAMRRRGSTRFGCRRGIDGKGLTPNELIFTTSNF